ncbi:hypothetical protein [Flavobacterium beibuense]
MALIEDYCESCGSNDVESIKEDNKWISVCNACSKKVVICAVMNEKA